MTSPFFHPCSFTTMFPRIMRCDRQAFDLLSPLFRKLHSIMIMSDFTLLFLASVCCMCIPFFLTSRYNCCIHYKAFFHGKNDKKCLNFHLTKKGKKHFELCLLELRASLTFCLQLTYSEQNSCKWGSNTVSCNPSLMSDQHSTSKLLPDQSFTNHNYTFYYQHSFEKSFLICSLTFWIRILHFSLANQLFSFQLTCHKK